MYTHRAEWISVRLTKATVTVLYRIPIEFLPAEARGVGTFNELRETRKHEIHQTVVVISMAVCAIDETQENRICRMTGLWPTANRLYTLYRAEVAFRDCSTGLTSRSCEHGIAWNFDKRKEN